AEPFGVTSGNPVAGIDFVGEDFELFNQDRRLDRVESRSETDPDIVVFITPLPMHTQAAEGFGKTVIVGHHCAAVAVATEWLAGEKTGGRRLAKRTQAPVVAGCSKSLGGVVENQQFLGACRSL